jgi:hypothetical protein
MNGGGGSGGATSSGSSGSVGTNRAGSTNNSGASIANTDKSYKDINDIILERLIHYNKLSNGFL